MDSTNTNELLVQQGKNIITSMKDLKRSAKKKGKARFDLYERFCANVHSFDVYTFMDPQFQESPEVVELKKQLELFMEEFNIVRTELNAEVNLKNLDTAYNKITGIYSKIEEALSK